MTFVSVPLVDGSEEFVNPEHIQAIAALPTPPGSPPRSRVVISSGANLQVAGTPRDVLELLKGRMVAL